MRPKDNVIRKENGFIPSDNIYQPIYLYELKKILYSLLYVSYSATLTVHQKRQPTRLDMTGRKSAVKVDPCVSAFTQRPAINTVFSRHACIVCYEDNGNKSVKMLPHNETAGERYFSV